MATDQAQMATDQAQMATDQAQMVVQAWSRGCPGASPAGWGTLSSSEGTMGGVRRGPMA
jgi:hypothetical protein